MERLAIVSHFDIDNIIDDYFLYFIDGLRVVSKDIIIVSTSHLTSIEIQKLSKFCIKVICRENVGYDFMSYKEGLLNSGIDYKKYDEIILCNDSIYGPLYDLSTAFLSNSILNCDFWGFTLNNQIEPHLQSYFLVFRKNIINSIAFSNFFNSIQIEKTKKTVINKYEVGLTLYFKNNGFSFKSYIKHPNIYRRVLSIPVYLKSSNIPVKKYKSCIISIMIQYLTIIKRVIKFFIKKVINDNYNPSTFSWENNISNGIPFLKINILRKGNVNNSYKEYIINTINKRSCYPTSLITNHINRTAQRYKKDQHGF